MTKIALFATVAVIALAAPAFAHVNPNGLNKMLGANAVIAHAPPSDFNHTPPAEFGHTPPSDFGAQSNGEVVIAHTPPSDFNHTPPAEFGALGKGEVVIAHAPPSDLWANGKDSLGGLDGMKVMNSQLLA
jgi:hypothetical protein